MIKIYNFTVVSIFINWYYFYDAIIVKESGVNAGFEEAALDAAWDRKYRPAMQNNQPVAVWVAYQVRFTLKN